MSRLHSVSAGRVISLPGWADLRQYQTMAAVGWYRSKPKEPLLGALLYFPALRQAVGALEWLRRKKRSRLLGLARQRHSTSLCRRGGRRRRLRGAGSVAGRGSQRASLAEGMETWDAESVSRRHGDTETFLRTNARFLFCRLTTLTPSMLEPLSPNSSSNKTKSS